MSGEAQARRRNLMLTAVGSARGAGRLYDVVRQLRADGCAKEVLLADLEEIRCLVTEDVEDEVLDVMDVLSDWCSPHNRID
jgi:hypothetical protein